MPLKWCRRSREILRSVLEFLPLGYQRMQRALTLLTSTTTWEKRLAKSGMYFCRGKKSQLRNVGPIKFKICYKMRKYMGGKGNYLKHMYQIPHSI